MVRFLISALSLYLLFSSSFALADVLFEGYSKVVSENKTIGIVISRYEFDNKKNHFISTYYTKIGAGTNEVSESLKAVSDSELNPISYEYTQLSNGSTKTIDAQFKGQKFTGIITENGKSKKINKTIEKGTFLSTFLVYLMMKSKTGLQADTTYEYSAIAEEDAEVTTGKAIVGKLETYNGVQTYKVSNTFKDISFISHISERGEVLGTLSTAHGIETQLAARPSEVLAEFKVNETILKTLFGEVPLGIKNILSSKIAAPTKPSEPLVIKNPETSGNGK